MRKITILLVVLSFLSCNKVKKEVDIYKDNKKTAILQMDMGRALYEAKMAEFEDDESKADSAYQVDKHKLVNDLFKDISKE